MARNSAAVIENNFKGGHVTEASGLNFPENACTETENCIFTFKGNVYRRLGFDYEVGYSTKTIQRDACAISTFLWKNVAGNSAVHLQVMQVGGTLYFWDIGLSSVISAGALSTSVTLSTYSPAGAPSPTLLECQFTEGKGLLFVTHPYLEPFFLSYNASTQTITATAIVIKIRDFEGIAETGVRADNRPISLTTEHRYNLANQGWPPDLQTTSSTSVTIGSAAKTFTVPAGLPFLAGDMVECYPTSVPGNNMQGTVTSYSGTTMVVTTTTNTGGANTYTDWNIVRVYAVKADHNTTVTPPGAVLTGPNWVRLWHTNLVNYPSNSDVPWLFQNSTGDFDTGTTQFKGQGNSEAPKGHFLLTMTNQDRSEVSGITGITATTSSYFRPATGAFMAGRMFYSGVQYQGFSDKIYFTQILESTTDTSRFGYCYQANDPTAETGADLLPSDGGVIVIPEVGTIINMVAVPGALLVFASNGVWSVTGSANIGFTANDYTVQKITTVVASSASSFVEAEGSVFFWTADGIWAIAPGQGGLSINSLTVTRNGGYYATIPVTSKNHAKGLYNPFAKTIQWVYNSTEAATLTTTYEFDSLMTFNLATQSFYNWTFDSSATTKINGIMLNNSTSAIADELTVISAASETIIDAAGDTVIAYGTAVNVPEPTMYLICSYASGGSYAFVFANERNTDYVDWHTSGTDSDFTSYFITGYRLRGDAQKKFQSNYVFVYSDNVSVGLGSYTIQGLWNYSNSTTSGKWTIAQSHTATNTNFDYSIRRFKLRGEGLALQLKITSVTGEPFDIIGWSTWDTANAGV